MNEPTIITICLMGGEGSVQRYVSVHFMRDDGTTLDRFKLGEWGKWDSEGMARIVFKKLVQQFARWNAPEVR